MRCLWGGARLHDAVQLHMLQVVLSPVGHVEKLLAVLGHLFPYMKEWRGAARAHRATFSVRGDMVGQPGNSHVYLFFYGRGGSSHPDTFHSIEDVARHPTPGAHPSPAPIYLSLCRARARTPARLYRALQLAILRHSHSYLLLYGAFLLRHASRENHNHNQHDQDDQDDQGDQGEQDEAREPAVFSTRFPPS